MEVGFVFWKLGDARPGALGWCAHNSEDFLKLVFICSAGKEGPAGVHFCHYAPCRPDVDAGVVGAGAKEHVGGAVPEGDNFVGEGVDGDAKGTGEAKVGEFELAFVIYQEVLRLKVAVEDTIVVAEGDALEELVHERFYGNIVELAARVARVHVLF